MTSRRIETEGPHRVLAALLLAICILACGVPAAAGEIAGVVRSSEGSATVTRGENVLPVTTGMKLQVGDVLSTGGDGSMGVIFRDPGPSYETAVMEQTAEVSRKAPPVSLNQILRKGRTWTVV